MKRIAALAAAAVLVVAGGLAVANDHHGSQGEHHSKKSKKAHHDNGRHLAKGHHKFDQRDREVTNTWCVAHRDRLPIGFRPVDRLEPRVEARLQIGFTLDLDLQRHIHPVPVDLLNQLPKPPVDLRYVAIGGHVALVDHLHRVNDLLPIPHLP